ncbi:MAG: peptide MFS transporter [Balneolaceae bacterium]|nr:peptide MFS transporter [Balneolaceae bacterium]
MANGQADDQGAATKKDFFGHPRGLSTLFFTEFWERFSYYGMRALLVLFMAAAVTGDNPGLGFSDGRATAIYGLYTFFVYVLAMPGGWVADNLWGQRKSVFVGGCIIALGHFTMAGPLVDLPNEITFYLGLFFIVVGTGLLKPNVSSMVGELYPEGGARRDAGFSIFYMGINFGAILGPTLCGILGEGYNWHWGFSLAGFGMLFGLLSYKFGEQNLGDAGKLKVNDSQAVLDKRSRNFWITTAVSTAVIILFTVLMNTGVIGISLQQLAQTLGTSVALIAVVFFAYLINDPKWIGGVLLLAVAGFFGASLNWGYTLFSYQIGIGVCVIAFLVINTIRMFMPSLNVTLEKKRLFVIFWLFILAALFWSGFEQAGSSLNLFAERETDRMFGPYGLITQIGTFLPALLLAMPLAYVSWRIFKRDNLWWVGKAGVAGLSLLVVGFTYYISTQLTVEWEMPASMLQNINPLFIVILAPVFGWLWTWLAHRDANPSIPMKFALGLLGLAAGFFVISWGSANASGPNSVSPAWLVVTYFLHTCGELCLSPVGLSSMTKLAPENRVSQMMGVWFVAAALGNLFAGLVAGQLETLAPTNLFWSVAMMVGGGGIVALLATPTVKRLMGDVE